MSPSFPKKDLLELLSRPKISKPYFAKKIEDSEPTNPHEPVIKTRAIDLNIYFCYLLK